MSKEYICPACDGVFKASHKRKYCNPLCRPGRLRKTGLSREERNKQFLEARKRVCIGCAKRYIKKKHGKHSDGEQYCSRECANSDRPYWTFGNRSWGPYSKVPSYTLIRYGNCKKCGTLIITNQGKQYCRSCSRDRWMCSSRNTEARR